MINFQNFKSSIVPKRSSLVTGAKTLKASTVPKGGRTSQNIWLFSKTTLMTKTLRKILNDVCVDEEEVHLYNHFVLCTCILLSTTGERLVLETIAIRNWTAPRKIGSSYPSCKNIKMNSFCQTLCH